MVELAHNDQSEIRDFLLASSKSMTEIVILVDRLRRFFVENFSNLSALIFNFAIMPLQIDIGNKSFNLFFPDNFLNMLIAEILILDLSQGAYFNAIKNGSKHAWWVFLMKDLAYLNKKSGCYNNIVICAQSAVSSMLLGYNPREDDHSLRLTQSMLAFFNVSATVAAWTEQSSLPNPELPSCR